MVLPVYLPTGVTSLYGTGKLLAGKRLSLLVTTVKSVFWMPIMLFLHLDHCQSNSRCPSRWRAYSDSTGALEIDAVPERLGVIGAGMVWSWAHFGF